jgi:hypothetical protein
MTPRKNPKDLVVTADTVFEPDVADLDKESHTWPVGRPMTEANTAEYTEARAKEVRRSGRPSLGATGSTSPQVAFRMPVDLRERAEKRAEAEGITVSALAREALERYLVNR